MPGPSRRARGALLAGCLAGLAACAPSADVRSCATSDECPAGSRCIAGACVANAPPSAVVTAPESPQANALLSFDASASVDPDPGDAIVSFAWAFRTVSAGACPAPVAAGTGPVANVRFGCPGRYAVDVTAKDQMGATSTATEELDVAAHDGAALLAVGEDVAVGHVCTATPRCVPSAPVALSATTPGIAPEQVTFLWTVEPPADRPLSATRRVTFSPGAASPSPSVAIETDGDAISGDWIFRVEARDAAGVVGTAATRVSVLNRPPAVTATIPSPDHAFTGSQLTAGGEVPFSVSDPDGDPLLDPAVEWRHAGDGGAMFTGVVLDLASRVTFSIVVPYSVPADAERLIGGPGLERSIVFAISDVNGGTASETWPIVVANRRPVLVSEPAPFTIDHRFDPDALAYVADVPLSTWSDPDGDPLRFAEGRVTGDPECPEVVVQGGVAHARCRLAYVDAPAVENFAGTHTVAQSVQDPWTEADATSHVTFTIGNRPPSITSSAVESMGGCISGTSCCLAPEGMCEAYLATISGIRHVASRWADPDGDPISVQVGAAGSYTPVQPLVCTPDACVLDVEIAPLAVCLDSPVTHLPTVVSDGLASASGSLPVQASCP